MKYFIFILSLTVLPSFAFAVGDKCHRRVAAEVRSWGHDEIDSIRFRGAYTAGTPIEAQEGSLSFEQSGYLYQVESNQMGGTGVSVVLVDAKCKVLEWEFIFAE